MTESYTSNRTTIRQNPEKEELGFSQPPFLASKGKRAEKAAQHFAKKERHIPIAGSLSTFNKSLRFTRTGCRLDKCSPQPMQVGVILLHPKELGGTWQLLIQLDKVSYSEGFHSWDLVKGCIYTEYLGRGVHITKGYMYGVSKPTLGRKRTFSLE